MYNIFYYPKCIFLLLFFASKVNAQYIQYTNPNNNNSTFFEACVGDVVTIQYGSFNNHPDRIQLTNDVGNPIYITLNPNGSNSNITYDTIIGFGTITLSIPSNAATGNVQFIHSNSSIYNVNNNLIIHKPSVTFYLPPAPFCATDTIPLIGVPAGGTFSTITSPANFINNNLLIGSNAGWSSNTNDSIKDVRVFYNYTPKYISGVSCPNSIQFDNIIRIRDNRLDTLEFQYIIKDSVPTINDRITLNTDISIVKNISPDITARHYPISFSGNYVNRINGVDSFFIENAGYGNHPITMEYNNGGCLGDITTNLDVLQPVQLSDVVDTLCKYSDSIVFGRNPSPEYSYSSTTTSSGLTTTTVESNIILSVSTLDSNHQSAIHVINSSPNQEQYSFDPAGLNTDTVIIIMHYIASRTTVQDSSGNSSVYSETPISFVEYRILLIDRPNISFSLDSTYCKNSAAINLVPSPTFNYPSSFFSSALLDSVSGTFILPDTFLTNQFDVDATYTQAGSLTSQNQDLYVQLTYTVDRYGCTDSHTEYTLINSSPGVNLNNLSTSYCINDAPVQLSNLTSPNNLSKYRGSGIIDTIQGIFAPAMAGIGAKIITYAFEDANGCGSSISKTTTIYPLPVLQPNFPQNQYCSSDSSITLDTSQAYIFWGNIIDSTNILNPQSALGQQTVFYSLTNSFGCTDTDSTLIQIHSLPQITINGLDSAYCINSSIDDILIYPAVTNLGQINGSSLGFNVNSSGGVTFAPYYDSSGIKSFLYSYTDNTTNCTNHVLLNTRVYDVPVLNYAGIDSTYCNVDSFYSITGSPSGGIFSGPGISEIGGQYYFNPIFTGGGNRVVNYRIDTNILYNSSDTLSCGVTNNIPVLINQLPNLAFNGPANSHRFCSNETDTLLDGIGASYSSLFTSTTPNAIHRNISLIIDSVLLTVTIDTTYYFSPNNAGAGVHHLTYSVSDKITGCQDSMPFTYYITDYGNGASFQLDSTYCAANDSIPLSGSPSGGLFLRDHDTLNTSYFFLDSSTYLLDTIIYHVTYDACMSSDTQVVQIHPLLNLSFYGTNSSKTYCFGDENPRLFPNISGGTFSGSAVISRDSLFSLEYAYTGGNIINYTLVDSLTNCESTTVDTFFAYGMPNIHLNTLGNCQLDSVFFMPNNTVLGLQNTFNGRIEDSITSVVWELEPGVFIPGNHNTNNEIDSISHIFHTPGVYNVKLIIANRTHCVDSNSVRVVISPTINSNQFPYDETFENSNGNWYAEAKDSSHSLLWEWGRDTIPQGINDPSNHIWATKLNDQYLANEAAWVYSPCFDISNLERPMIRFDHWSDSRNRGDGSVLEFQNPDGTWSPLGDLDRGINWFNAGFIAGSPGDQTLSPIGWSGQIKEWVNSRYKLDDFRNILPSKLRLRMAFGSSSINLGSFHNGFAFDNVWIGSRTRNVLLETTSNMNEPNMDYINHYVYQLTYHSTINKDVILLQYHSDSPDNSDEFHQFDTRLGNVKPYIYGIPDAGTAFIDGIDNTRSAWLNEVSFEQDMLETPKFDVVIDTFQHTNQPSEFTMVVTITALVDIPAVERYQINMFITEDSLSYSSGEKVHAVVRKDYPSNSINNFNRSWAVGDQITLSYTYSATDLNYVPNRFQAVAFIQAEDPNAREVFQAATTRDVSGYWVGVDQVVSEQELNEIKDMTLYPNPAKDYINIDFPELLKKDYKWKLISIGGITLKEDVIHAGEQSLTINNYDLPSGVYIFMVYNGNVYSQRKVIINQD